jgi:RNA polymerase sigma-70 factor (ECF subfamily)
MNEAKRSDRLGWVRSVLDEYEAPLTRYAARIIGDLDLAREAVQETFLRLCTQEPAEVDGHLAQWLYTVCRSRAVDMQRKERRMQALDESQVDTREALDCDPAVVTESHEGVTSILQVLALLPANQQEVVRLRFQNGLRYKEIASFTGLSVSNVGYLIHTAIKSIREALGTCDQIR